MTAQEPSSNDNEFTLLKKLVINTSLLGVSIPAIPGQEAQAGGQLGISVVAKYSDLPTSVSVAPVDSVVLVIHSTGVWPVTDHSSGFYIRRGASGQLSDWEEL